MLTLPSISTFVRRMLCDHSSTEMWRASAEVSPAIRTTWTARHICSRCGRDML